MSLYFEHPILTGQHIYSASSCRNPTTAYQEQVRHSTHQKEVGYAANYLTLAKCLWLFGNEPVASINIHQTKTREELPN